MLMAALRDLQWRRRRYVITIIATALVFGMSLIMSGLAATFPNEVHKLIGAIGGESYLAVQGETGPFSSTSFVPTSTAPDADPLFMWFAALGRGTNVRQIGIVGLPAHWKLPVHRGRTVHTDDEIVVDSSLGVKLGGHVTLGHRSYLVVGTTSDYTIFGGEPIVFITVPAAQRSLAGGAPIARAFVERNTPSGAPPKGLSRFTRKAAETDLLRPLKSAADAIAFVKFLLWLVAACIVGSVTYLSAIERTRDFAVFKATGVKSYQIGMGMALQAVIIAIVASIIAFGIAFALAPVFPMPVAIPMNAVVTLPLLAIVVGLAASGVALRRALAVDPAAAFGGR
jgi:putative ABC transport system permease protein